ncbi:MAG: TrkH family potassium uptake protein [Deltaproteobacteria bacterium]|nr:TrkH family potassium uptake protein [Deltaproteobacteria bacterium]
MNIPLTLKILGSLLIFLAAALLIPLPFSFYFRDGMAAHFFISSFMALAAGMILYRGFDSEKELSIRDGFSVVTFGWLFYAAFGALPYLISGVIPAPTDALFETMSGFTTTGATILRKIEGMPESILLWRALTHWMGGMGIIVLSLAILPMLGVGGMQLFQAEVPGPTADRLKPRIEDTAKLLWGVYVLLTALETILLMIGGMNLYEALCHAFATLATGGFSTRDASVGAFGSPFIDWVIILFMFLAGINFSLHYYAIRGRIGDYFRNEECRFYIAIAFLSILVLMAANHQRVYDSPLDNLRFSAFQAISILTTTGFGTADYELWPSLTGAILLFLMFVGGCAGSTGGGMKVARVLLLFKHARFQLYHLIHPRAVSLVKLGDVPVDSDVMQSILGFFALFAGVFVFASFLMAATGLDMMTAATSVIATLGNIGPGFGAVGPADNYAHIAPFGKWVLTACMLCGRLELFTVLVLFFPSLWRK